MMPERASRTFICSVLFLDIVEYSRKPVAEQIRLKDRFNGLIASAIREISPADRIILDTGDGVAISFLGDPEDALFVAMSLRDAFAPRADEPPEVPARIGLNLGPVRLVRDLNGRPNIIGDGINVAQRVMGFANAGQILVSRSYFEIVSHISDSYTKLFTYQGSRTDKHVREHEIYSVGYSTAEAPIKSPAERARRSTSEAITRTAAGNATTVRLLFHVEKWLGNRSIAFGTTAFSVLAFMLALFTSFLAETPQESRAGRSHAPGTTVAKSPVAATRNVATDEPILATGEATQQHRTGDGQPDSARHDSGTQNSDNVDDTPEEPVQKPKRRLLRLPFFGPKPDSEPEQDAATETATGQDSPLVAESSEQTRSAAQSEMQDGVQSAATNTARLDDETTYDAASAQQPSATGERASVALAISPWGEVYVDGKQVGVSPPLNEIELLPGSRVIEIRNGDFPPFLQRVELKPRQKIKIRYKFN